MPKSQLPTPDSISGNRSIGTQFTDLNPAARPISVYERPTTQNIAEPVKDNSLSQLSRALADIQPTLNQGVKYIADIQNEKDLAAGEVAGNKAAQDKTVKDLSRAVEDGLIPAGASPAYNRAAQATFLKARSQQYSSELTAAYDASEAKQSDDPAVFQKFLNEFSTKFTHGLLYNDDGTPKYTPLEINDSKFFDTMGQYANQLRTHHNTFRANERTEIGKQNAGIAASTVLDSFFNNSVVQKDYKGGAEALVNVYRDPVTGIGRHGLTFSDINPLMTNDLATHALKSLDTTLMERVGREIKTNGGKNSMYDVPAFRAKAQEISLKIESERYQKIMREDAVDKLEAQGTREERIAFYEQQADAGKKALVRDKLTREYQTDIYLAPNANAADIEKRTLTLQKLYSVNPEAAASVQQTLQRLEEHAHDVARKPIYDEFEARIRAEILASPVNPHHEDRIIQAFRDDAIDRDQMRSLLSNVQYYRQNGESHSALKDPGYLALEQSAYSGTVKDLSKIGGQEAVEAGKAKWEFRSEALSAIQAHPELAKDGPGLAAYMEKRLTPIVERHNVVMKQMREQDELNRKTQEQVLKAVEMQKELDLYDAGKGPNPNAPKQPAKPKPVSPQELGQRLSGDEKKSLSSSLDRAFLPGTKEKPITEQELRDTVRNIFKPHYPDLGDLNEAVNQFITAQKKSKRYAK